jgi:hypothetical protein
MTVLEEALRIFTLVSVYACDTRSCDGVSVMARRENNMSKV